MRTKIARLCIISVNYLTFVSSDLVIRLELRTAIRGLKVEAQRDVDGFGDELISGSLSHLSTRLLTGLFFSLDLTLLPSFFISFTIFTVFFCNS